MMKFLVALFIVLNCSQVFAFDIAPSLDTLTNSATMSSNAQTNDAMQHAAKALFIQSGFQTNYSVLQQTTNTQGNQGQDITAKFIDENTWFSHDEVFGAVGLAVIAAKKSVSTSFADPLFPIVKHYINIGTTQQTTGIRITW